LRNRKLKTMYFKKFILFLIILLLVTSCNKNSDDEDDLGQEGDFGSITFYKNDPFPCNTISISLTNYNGDVLVGEPSGTAVVSGTPCVTLQIPSHL